MKTIYIYHLLLISVVVQAQRRVEKENVEIDKNDSLCIYKYKGKPYSGKVYYFHPNGSKEAVYTIKNGMQHGKIIVFFDSGKKHAKIYEDENHVNYGKVNMWDERGVVAFKGYYKNGRLYKKGKEKPFTGQIKTYYKFGQPAGISEFKNGYWDGKQFLWDRDGNMTGECIFKDNKIVDCPVYKEKK